MSNGYAMRATRPTAGLRVVKWNAHAPRRYRTRTEDEHSLDDTCRGELWEHNDPPRGRGSRGEMTTSNDDASDRGGVFRCQRVIPDSPERVFDAFATPDTLARWWGPDGFTNTFEVFEFRVGGRWKYVMHGPKGTHHPNESVFVELSPSAVVIQHVSNPRYRLRVTLTPSPNGGTAIDWLQEFEDVSVAARIRHIVEPANEQNLDRLEGVLRETSGPTPTAISQS